MEDFCELVSRLPEKRCKLMEQMALQLLEREGESEGGASPEETAKPLDQIREKINEMQQASDTTEISKESRTYVVMTFEELNSFLKSGTKVKIS